MVADDTIGHTALDEIGWDVKFVGVDEARDDIVVTIELGDGFEPA